MIKQKIQATVATFFQTGIQVEFAKGEMIIAGQSQPEYVFYIQEGLVKMYGISANGEEATLNLFRYPSFFSMLWVMGEVPNTYFFQAVTPTKCWKLPVAQVRQFLQDNPEVLYDVSQRILLGVSGLLTQVEKLMYGNSQAKVANMLLLLSERFGEKEHEHAVQAHIPLRFTHPELASLIGVTRETVSRELGYLKKHGIIEYSTTQLIVLDLPALKSLI